MAEQLLAVKEPSVPSSDPGAPVGKTEGVAGLVGITLLTLLGTAVVLAGVVVLANRPAWWSGLLAAGVISLFAAMMSLAPLVWGLRRGMYQRVAAWFIAAGLRAVVSLGGALLAVRVGQYPAAPTMLMMVVFYFGLLAAESACIARALWDTKD